MNNPTKTETWTFVYPVRIPGQAEPIWRAVLDRIPIAADFNSRGAAEAALEVERRRRAKETQ